MPNNNQSAGSFRQALQKHQQPLRNLLPTYEQARQLLAQCVRVDEAKDIRDKADALRAYARQRQDHELETMCAEIKLRATRRIGEISEGLEKSSHGPGRGKRLANGGKAFSKARTLKSAGISVSSAHRAERIARIPQVEFERRLAKAREQHRPIRFDDLLRSVRRARVINGAMSGGDLWSNRLDELFGSRPTNVRRSSGTRIAEIVGTVVRTDMDHAKLALLNLAHIRDRRYRQLVHDLIDDGEDALVEAFLQHLVETPLDQHEEFFEQQFRLAHEDSSLVDFADVSRKA
jgi:hypothetical protein